MKDLLNSKMKHRSNRNRLIDRSNKVNNDIYD